MAPLLRTLLPRVFRCSYATTTPPDIVRDFDTLLHDMYL
jgi:hypothetical protein